MRNSVNREPSKDSDWQLVTRVNILRAIAMLGFIATGYGVVRGTEQICDSGFTSKSYAQHGFVLCGDWGGPGPDLQIEVDRAVSSKSILKDDYSLLIVASPGGNNSLILQLGFDNFVPFFSGSWE